MSATKLTADAVGIPRFDATPAASAEVFDLTSHARAHAALDFGLSVAAVGFNIFVVGEDRSARMSATLAQLGAAMAQRPVPSDWIYLNNFRHPDRPVPLALPAGTARRFCDALAALLPKLREALAASFTGDAYQARVLALREQAEREVKAEMENLAHAAQAHGLQLAQGEDGALRLMPAAQPPGAPPPAIDEATEREMAGALTRVQIRAVNARGRLAAQIQELNRGIAAEVASPALDALARDFAAFPGLGRWLTDMRADMTETPERFQLQPGGAPDIELPERRYAVNLFVDHGGETHAPVVLQANPSYEHLFGWIEYRQSQGSLQTDFLQIRAGALHRANGGVLVLRAEAIAVNPASWAFLKGALRDRVVRIEELSRAQSPPIAGAPQPGPIPLDVKVVLVGAPRWYATFFDGDPDFRTYFKINADIDNDTPADARNLGLYAALIAAMVTRHGLEGASRDAIALLLGVAARWAERRDRLTARVELLDDLVAEAAALAQRAGKKTLDVEIVAAAHHARSRRNARIEEAMLKHVVDGMMLIDTSGSAIGHINALTVNVAGDHEFGTPVRVTARAYAGRAGVINIERFIGTGGPIQQKGAMVLEGFLAGKFAQVRPLSFTCSITFEQVYGGVEGDSASMAELIAVLSDLAQLPIRQDIAITGSVNQEGVSQPIGGAHWKIEGFYHVCAAKPGGLTGTQGVIVPQANRISLVLRDEVAEAIAAGRFHLWSVGTVEDAAALLLGMPAGAADAAGNYPPDSIFGRVAARLDAFDRILMERVRDSRDDGR
ncbi:MAG TPA: AAA family ATPase [Stellaceae bacterium]|jgi:predicted ATP-dependent protease|nr:AAA family ATPase [Stellaceae bacterium]